MTVEEMVRECLERGGLEATARGQKSLTVDGVSLAPIRWQSAVFSFLYAGHSNQLPPRARHLTGPITRAIEYRRPSTLEGAWCALEALSAKFPADEGAEVSMGSEPMEGGWLFRIEDQASGAYLETAVGYELLYDEKERSVALAGWAERIRDEWERRP